MASPRLGGLLISVAALLGAAVSVYNYFAESSGIQGTGGAMLVIVSSAVLGVLGPGLGGGRSRVLAAVSLILILGTAFAAWLLESSALLALMAASFLGWLLHVFAPRRAAA
jgi:hypothetical protein